MRNRLWLPLMIGILMFALAGCAASGYSKMRDGMVELKGKNVLVFPTDILVSGNSDKLAQNAAFSGGFYKAFMDNGVNGLDGMPFKPAFDSMGIGLLSYWISREGTASVESGTWDLSLGDKANMLVQVSKFIADKAGKPLDYVVFSDVWDKGQGSLPGTRAVWVMGVIWDVKANKMVSAAKWKEEWPAVDGAEVAKLTETGPKLVSYLTGKSKL